MTHPFTRLSDPLTRLRVDAVRELHDPRTLATAAVLSAVHLVLNQFTIPVSQLLEVGFDFLAVAAIGYLCGPWVAGLSGIVTDLLGYILRPNGPYFPGWTLSAILVGVLYGLWLYRRPIKLWRVVLCKLNMVLLFNFLLTPLWLHITYGQSFVVLSSLRLVKNVIKFPLDILLLMLVLKTCERVRTDRR
ncbi:folate family ECF transporter S component [uncultured Subdoligranulum sp.]|uniref:folate family ECF transporter S component n=1 Tax=uncultured Subdoligranulum sp. TaxID=512298 RepID=UPI0025DF10A1|nr:folate family ECF transporter S component [uncultured Subdoligranulum sp.]